MAYLEQEISDRFVGSHAKLPNGEKSSYPDLVLRTRPLTQARFQIRLDGLPAVDDIRDDSRAFAQRQFEHIVVSELGEQFDDVVKVGEDHLLQCLPFLCLCWGFADM